MSDPAPEFEGFVKKTKTKQSSSKDKVKDMEKQHYNSTGTVLINSTISAPNIADLLEACGEFVQKNITTIDHCKTSQEKEEFQEMMKKYEIFNEDLHPITKIALDDTVPTLDQVRRHFTVIYRIAELAPEALVMGISYLRRLMRGGILLAPLLWRRLILSCLMVASKVWEELAVWLTDFVQVFPSLQVDDLNCLERYFLEFLKFDVALSAKEYAETYFELRAQSKSVEKTFASCKPLDRKGEEKLELCTKKYHYHLPRKDPVNTNFQSLDMKNSTKGKVILD